MSSDSKIALFAGPAAAALTALIGLVAGGFGSIGWLSAMACARHPAEMPLARLSAGARFRP